MEPSGSILLGFTLSVRLERKIPKPKPSENIVIVDTVGGLVAEYRDNNGFVTYAHWLCDIPEGGEKDWRTQLA